MNPKQTWILVGIALALLGFIYFFERHQPGADERRLPPKVFPDLQAREVDAMEVTYPAAGGHARVEKKEGEWVLTEPAYPGQQTAIETLVATLEELRKLEPISPHDVLVQGRKAFGFDPPRAILQIEAGTNRHTLQVGAPTPLTTNVYVRLEPSGEVFVTDGKLPRVIPGSVNAWRSAQLVDVDELEFDQVRIRAGNRLLELERNPTNNLWQISKPIVARADQNRVAALFQALRGARVNQFVEDGAAARLEKYSLESPAVELTFLRRTNAIFELEFGSSPTNAPGQVYARRVNTTNVVLADKGLADFLMQPYKQFHDPRLISFDPEALDRIRVQSVEEFALQRREDGSWWITEPVTNQADPVLMNYFMTNLLELEIVDLAKEVPSEQDLAGLGILNPVASYALFEQYKDEAGRLEQILFTEISFGRQKADTIYVKRSDETPVYITPLAGLMVLPRHAFEVRDRQIWRFDPTNVVSIAMSLAGRTNTTVRDPAFGWSRDPIQNAAAREVVYRLGNVEAMGWVAKGADRLDRFGIKDDSAALSVTLNSGGMEEERQTRFGIAYRGGVYASSVLPGDEVPTVFLFPATLYEDLLKYFAPR